MQLEKGFWHFLNSHHTFTVLKAIPYQKSSLWYEYFPQAWQVAQLGFRMGTIDSNGCTDLSQRICNIQAAILHLRFILCVSLIITNAILATCAWALKKEKKNNPVSTLPFPVDCHLWNLMSPLFAHKPLKENMLQSHSKKKKHVKMNQDSHRNPASAEYSTSDNQYVQYMFQQCLLCQQMTKIYYLKRSSKTIVWRRREMWLHCGEIMIAWSTERMFLWT